MFYNTHALLMESLELIHKLLIIVQRDMLIPHSTPNIIPIQN